MRPVGVFVEFLRNTLYTISIPQMTGTSLPPYPHRLHPLRASLPPSLVTITLSLSPPPLPPSQIVVLGFHGLYRVWKRGNAKACDPDFAVEHGSLEDLHSRYPAHILRSSVGPDRQKFSNVSTLVYFII